MWAGVCGAKSVTGGGRLQHVHGEQLADAGRDERRPAGQHLVQHHAQRVDVGAVVDLAGAPALLRRHVDRRPHQRADARLHRLRQIAGVHDLRDAEVEQLDVRPPRRRRQQLDVVRLEIAVNDPLVVGGAERAADLIGDLGDLGRRDGAARDALVHRLAAEELHDEVGLPVGGLTEVEDLDDVLVPDGVDGARLVEEAGDDLGLPRQRHVQQLDRDLAPDDRVLGLIDHAHAPLAQLAGDPVVADRLPDQAQCSEHRSTGPQLELKNRTRPRHLPRRSWRSERPAGRGCRRSWDRRRSPCRGSPCTAGSRPRRAAADPTPMKIHCRVSARFPSSSLLLHRIGLGLRQVGLIAIRIRDRC